MIDGFEWHEMDLPALEQELAKYMAMEQVPDVVFAIARLKGIIRRRKEKGQAT